MFGPVQIGSGIARYRGLHDPRVADGVGVGVLR